MAIFKLITSPARHRYFSAAYKVKWFSWSDEFLQLLPEIERAARRYGKPVLKDVNGWREYKKSFHVNPDLTDRDFLLKVKPFLLSLAHFRVGKGLNFFSGLINSRIDGQLYHFIMALFRGMLEQLYRQQGCALYPGTGTGTGSGLPECGMHIPDILWQVTGEPAPGRMGATLFLPVQTLDNDILPGLAGLPASKARRIIQLIQKASRTDRYDELHDLLYGPGNKWTKELKEKILLRAGSIKFSKGQGFMIHDRLWMHGINGGQPFKQPFRLLFTNP